MLRQALSFCFALLFVALAFSLMDLRESPNSNTAHSVLPQVANLILPQPLAAQAVDTVDTLVPRGSAPAPAATVRAASDTVVTAPAANHHTVLWTLLVGAVVLIAVVGYLGFRDKNADSAYGGSYNPPDETTSRDRPRRGGSA